MFVALPWTVEKVHGAEKEVETVLPKLAIISHFKNKEYDFFKDLLHAEFSNQDVFDLVGREIGANIFDEYSLTLNQKGPVSLNIGKIKGADYLLILSVLS